MFVDSALICVEAFAAPRPQWPGIYIGALLHIKISIYYIRKIDKAVPRVTGLDVRGGTEVQIER